jgi:vancomycin resistance protein VanW
MTMIDRATVAVPTAADMALFAAKAACFRLKRATQELLRRDKACRHAKGMALRDAPIVARVASPLWNRFGGMREHALTAGKIENLRRALRHVDGIEVPAGRTFSFWAQIGRATRHRGFVEGRELREGCLIPTIGGGLCQLSNALHEAALEAGFEIVERHAHSRIVPGSRADASRDATVFWNYVDLRFRSPYPFRIEARLTRGELRLAIRALRTPRTITATIWRIAWA